MSVPWSSRFNTLTRIFAGEHDGAEFGKLLAREVKTIPIDSDLAAATSGVGAAAGTGVTAVEYGDAIIHKTVLTVTALSVTSTDATTSGAFGTQKVYDFPAGPIQILGCKYDLALTKSGAGIDDAAEVVVGLGTAAATAGATLASTEQDLIGSTVATLSAGAGAARKHGSLVATAYDGHTTPIDAILNFAMPDAGTSANAAILFTGTITIHWINLGDYT